MIIGAEVITQSADSKRHWVGKVSAIVAAPSRSGNSNSKVGKSNAAPMLCKVSYDGWGEEYSNWVNADRVFLDVDGDDARMTKLLSQHQRDLQESPPEEFRCLQAFTWINSPGRASARNPASYSVLTGTHTDMKFRGSPTLLLVKKAMLLVEAALPIGALDKSDEKWGRKQFGQAWREAVMSAPDAATLMPCQLLLEFSIKQQWVRMNNTRGFSLLPCRAFALRHATVGMVAMRLYALDHMIKYDKVEKEAGRKVAFNYALSSASASSSSSSAAKGKMDESETDEAMDDEDGNNEEGFRRKKSHGKKTK